MGHDAFERKDSRVQLRNRREDCESPGAVFVFRSRHCKMAQGPLLPNGVGKPVEQVNRIS